MFKTVKKSKLKEPYSPLLGDAKGQLPEGNGPSLPSVGLRLPALRRGDSPQVPPPLLDVSGGGPAPQHGAVAGQLLQEPRRCRRVRLLGGKELCETEEARLKHGTRPGAGTPRRWGRHGSPHAPLPPPPPLAAPAPRSLPLPQRSARYLPPLPPRLRLSVTQPGSSAPAPNSLMSARGRPDAALPFPGAADLGELWGGGCRRAGGEAPRSGRLLKRLGCRGRPRPWGPSLGRRRWGRFVSPERPFPRRYGLWGVRVGAARRPHPAQCSVRSALPPWYGIAGWKSGIQAWGHLSSYSSYLWKHGDTNKNLFVGVKWFPHTPAARAQGCGMSA